MSRSSGFLRNCWYVAAHWEELDGQPTLSRTILQEAIILLKDSDGAWRALADRCPHRFAPLSMGTCREGTVTCAYHGLSFDAAGRCVGNPTARSRPR